MNNVIIMHLLACTLKQLFVLYSKYFFYTCISIYCQLKNYVTQFYNHTMNQKILKTAFLKIEYEKLMKTFPKMSRQQIVTKVFLLWKNVSQQQKKELYRQYLERGLIKQSQGCKKSSSICQKKPQHKPYLQESSQSSNLSQSQHSSSFTISHEYESLPIYQQKQENQDKSKDSKDDQMYQNAQNLQREQKKQIDSHMISGVKSYETSKIEKQEHFFNRKIQEMNKAIKKIQNLSEKQIMKISEQNTPQTNQKQQISLSSQIPQCSIAIESPLQEIKMDKRQDNPSKTQYLRFYIYYYKKIHKQYPHLQPIEITIMIKILWKQQKAKKKEQVSQKQPIRGKTGKLSNRLSGKQLFFKQKIREGFIKRQIKQMWIHLPFQSKQQWQKNSYDPDFQIKLVKQNKPAPSPSQIIRKQQIKSLKVNNSPLQFLRRPMEYKTII